jgi:hypothetical protein
VSNANISNSVANTNQLAAAGIDHVDMSGNSYQFGGPPSTMWTDNYAEIAANMLGARTRRNIAYSGSRSCWSDNNTNGIHGGWSWVLQNLHVPGMTTCYISRAWPYLPISKLVVMEDTLNDLAAIGAGNSTPYLHAHRTIIAAHSLAAIWLAAGADTPYGTALDSAITLATSAKWTLVSGGGEQAPTAALKNTHSNAGQGYRYTSTVGSTIAFTTPTDADEARIYDVCIPVAQIDNYMVTVKVASTTYPAFTISGATMCDPDTSTTGAASVLNGVTLRLGSGGPTDPTNGLAIGSATSIIVTLTALTAGNFKFSHIGMECNPLDGPLFIPLSANRMPPITVGYTFFSTGDGFPHGYNAPTYPLNDSNVLNWITLQQNMESAEFPQQVISLNADTALGANPLYWNDGGASGLNINPHPNAKGHRQLAIAIKTALLNSSLLTDRVRSAAKIPVRDFFLDVGYVSETAYQNGWVESTFYGIFTTTPGGITIDMNGVVQIKAILNGASATATQMFTMPVDLRPAGDEVIYIPARVVYTPSGGSQITVAGFVTVQGNSGAVGLDTPPSGVIGTAGCVVSFYGSYTAEH